MSLVIHDPKHLLAVPSRITAVVRSFVGDPRVQTPTEHLFRAGTGGHQ